MAFTLFKKKAQPPPHGAAEEKRKESTLVPVSSADTAQPDRPVKIKENVRDWKPFPIDAQSVLVRPVFTEKALRLAQANTFTFEVCPSANKISIKKAFYNCYGVMPTDIKVLRIDGKHVRYGRTAGVRKNVKKALVSVPRSASITI